MARQARLTLAGEPHLLAQTAGAGVPLYADEVDGRSFVDALRHAARETRTAVHGWVLLPDQAVVLATPSTAEGVGRLMQRVGRRYVQHYNARHAREGALWEQRFRSSLLEAEPWLMLALRHLEDLPVQRGLASRPQDYRHSSAAHHMLGAPDTVVTEPAAYWRLGNTPFEREAAYAVLMQSGVEATARASLEVALSRGRPLGSASWLSGLARTIGRPLEPGKPGRPARRPKLAHIEPSG